jgi:hypothetical protein
LESSQTTSGSPWLWKFTKQNRELLDRIGELTDLGRGSTKPGVGSPANRVLKRAERVVELPDRVLELPDRVLELPDRVRELVDWSSQKESWSSRTWSGSSRPGFRKLPERLLKRAWRKGGPKGPVSFRDGLGPIGLEPGGRP